jgi:hypothetical protein
MRGDPGAPEELLAEYGRKKLAEVNRGFAAS